MGDESSDLQSSCAIVDTAKEETPDGGSSSSSGSSSADPKKPRKGAKPGTGGGPATGDGPATGGPATGGGPDSGGGADTGGGPDTGEALPPGPRRGRAFRPPVYDNGYFYITDNTGETDVKICIHNVWKAAPPLGMGRQPQMSKTLTPVHYGEARENPARSTFLLRAWMIWRARQNGFAAADAARGRLFDDEALRLERDVKHFQPQADGLLGNTKATSLFMGWVPDVAARVRV